MPSVNAPSKSLVPAEGVIINTCRETAPGLAEDFDLVQQAVVGAARPEGLAVVVHHHRHRADAVVAQQAKRFFGFDDALAFVDQRGGHVFHTEPQRPATGFMHQFQMIFHHQRVVNGGLGAPADFFVQRNAIDARVGQGLHYFDGALLVIEEVVIRAEEISDAVGLVQPGEFFGYPARAFQAVLPLVVRRDRAVGAGEFAPES